MSSRDGHILGADRTCENSLRSGKAHMKPSFRKAGLEVCEVDSVEAYRWRGPMVIPDMSQRQG